MFMRSIRPLKDKKCKHCKNPFSPRNPLQYVCSPGCAIARSAELNSKRFLADAKKEKKEWYDKNKTLSQLEAEARKPFQKWIRQRDANLPCISCGCKTAKQWDGGHYLKAEIYSGLIFSEENCHKQCSVCNDFKSGNELMYRDGLIKRYGAAFIENLEATKDQHRNYKYSRQQLVEIKEHYQSLLKQNL